jgi:hypothetical protein
VANTSAFSIPDLSAILDTISAFVILFYFSSVFKKNSDRKGMIINQF